MQLQTPAADPPPVRTMRRRQEALVPFPKSPSRWLNSSLDLGATRGRCDGPRLPVVFWTQTISKTCSAIGCEVAPQVAGGTYPFRRSSSGLLGQRTARAAGSESGRGSEIG